MRTQRLTGRVVLPGDSGYPAARRNYNLRYDVLPQVIVFCQTVCDVSNAVRWARENHIRMSVRSGRHAYEPLSVGDGIVIDVVDLDTIAIDPENRLAEVGAGVALMPLYEELWTHGLTVPGGSCATVGIAGLTLGGGFGLLSRAMGLTCDNLVKVEMIDASGARVTATETHHPDLLWASRGGGGGTFGIVTSLTFKLHPIGAVATYRMEWPWGELPAVLDAWQRWAPFTDDRLTSIIQLRAASTGIVASIGLFVGSADELARLLGPFVSTCVPRSMEIKETSFIEATRMYAGVTLDARQWSAHWNAEGSTRFKHSSDYARAPLGPEAVRVIQGHLGTAPNTEAELQLDAYGGAVNRVSQGATAFPHRAGTLYSMQYKTYWKDDTEESENIRWVEEFRTALRPFVSGEAYVGYADASIPDWPRAYFGPNLSRLVAIKAKYDPEDVFHHAQSVRLPEAEPLVDGRSR